MTIKINVQEKHDCKAAYKKLAQKIAALEFITDQSKEYWTEREKVARELSDFVYHQEYFYLDAHQLLRLCSWMGRYRPVEPFRFLSLCSQQLDKHGR